MKDSYGRKCTEFARSSNPGTSWSKTSLGCSQLLIGWEDEEPCSEEFLETWPRSGIVSNGIAYRLPPLTLSTGETESGSWPTPNTMDYLKPRDEETIEEYNNSRDGRKNRKALSNLRQAVTSPHYSQMFPTPQAADAISGEDERNRKGSGGPNLLWIARRFPTPTSRDWKDTQGMAQTGVNPDGSSRERLDQLPRVVYAGLPTGPDRPSGGLNPMWVEWLMGFPLGWTDLDHSETP